MSQVRDREPHASHSDRKIREFQITGSLPSGITVLEASAGTGKTYTIASLAARYVADGVPLEKMLFVTFTRLATGELRERVRERLIEVERGLAAPQSQSSADEVVALLAAGDAELHRRRIAQAIAGFDAATILTTHSFCQDMLEGLGIAGELAPDVRFAEDLTDLRDDVVDDLYLRRFRGERAPALDLAESRTIVRVAMTDATAEVVMPAGGVGAMRARLASAGRAELELRKQRARLMTYDDYVNQLQRALDGPNREVARAALRSRFDVVLVDEFQDTDPTQWEVLDRGFVQTSANVVLIGDPKQAIYAFRGADVYAYLRAVRSADEQATLLTNWRSDQDLLDAHDALFANAQLGHPGIVYRTVRAAPGHRGSRLDGAPVGEAMRFRVVPRDSPLLSTNKWGMIDRPSAESFIARDLAGDAVALLRSRARVAGVEVCPGDLAVLVRTNAQAALVQQALSDAGVPAVVNGAGSVFATDTAQDWLRLLESLERPSATGRAHAAALTCFIGWSAQRLATAIADGSPEWEEIHQRLHEWARILRARGVASLVETVTVGEDLPARMLAATDGERRLTDLRHIGQLLHAAAVANQLGPTALAAWLRARIDEGEGEEERTRRLESDDDAVQVLTVHRSKGAEFGIVYVPYLWAGWAPRDNPPVYFHASGADDARRLDVAREGPEYERHLRQNTVEQRGEELRLAYVALTRARHQTVLWWAASAQTRHSPLTRLLFSRDEDGTVATDGGAAPKDPAVIARLEQLRALAPHAISVERAEPDLDAHWSPAAAPRGGLAASEFHRSLDLRWRRTSYTDMTAASYDARVGSEPEEPLLDDEPDADEPVAATALAAAPELALPALLGDMPVGADVGTFVHGVLEATDFAAADLGAELRGRIAEVRAHRAVDIGDPEQVAEGLAEMIRTPLGDVVGGIALRDVARPDRLDELGFELPLAGGDQPGDGWVTVDRIAGVLRDVLPARDPLAGYAARLDDPFLRRTVRGYLTGSLDLVLRLADGRFAVLDYKTNWLGEPGEPLTSFDYRPAALAAEMYRHHYALQALLYTVALHRFLRWRLVGYDPDQHLAGVAYLFVRGMTGRGAIGFGGAVDGSAPGVFAWRPPSGLAAALSDALDEGLAVSIGAGTEEHDPFDARWAVQASGPLREFNRAGILSAADVHVARRLGQLAGESSDVVLLAVALAVRAPRIGHVLVDLESIRDTAAVDTEEPIDLESLQWPPAADWVAQVAGSPLVGLEGRDDASVRPLRLRGSWLYLDRYWSEELAVAGALRSMLDDTAAGVDADVLDAGVARLFPRAEEERQAAAAAAAVRGRCAVVAGGPGTGKTTTVARIVALLREQGALDGRAPMIALAAPTGKAAARLQESVRSAAEHEDLEISPEVRDALRELPATTIHRLLGWRPDSNSRFRHDRNRRLPHDVVIVDETSMVSLSLMARLIEALRSDARLVLVGDPGQLASIEAGAVLGDVVGEDAGTTREGIVVLDHGYRFGGSIAPLAAAIREGDGDAVMELLSARHEDVIWVDADPARPDTPTVVRSGALDAARSVLAAARAGDSNEALKALGRFRILCAHRRGSYGVSTWTARLEGWLQDGADGLSATDRWYVGRPLLVTENDYELGLNNGDTGVVVAGADGRVMASFERGGEPALVSPSRLGAVDTVYAMTIHKSQGSQFEAAAVLLPEDGSRILTRELLYTAATRARKRLILVGSETTIRGAVGRPVARASGLAARLWGV